MVDTNLIGTVDGTIDRLSRQVQILSAQLEITQYMLTEAIQAYLMLKQALSDQAAGSEDVKEEEESV